MLSKMLSKELLPTVLSLEGSHSILGTVPNKCLTEQEQPLAAASTNEHLSPTSDRIARNRKTIVCPMIDVIDHDDFRYETQAGDAMRGAFDWEMYYKRIPIPPELQKADPSDPFE